MVVVVVRVRFNTMRPMPLLPRLIQLQLVLVEWEVQVMPKGHQEITLFLTLSRLKVVVAVVIIIRMLEAAVVVVVRATSPLKNPKFHYSSSSLTKLEIAAV